MNVQQIDAQAYGRFQRNLSALLSSDLLVSEQDAGVIAEDVIERMAAAPGCLQRYNEVQSKLASDRIQRRWNQVFARYRSAYMAVWMLPHIHGKTLDLFCGDGKVGERLATNGIDVLLCERDSVCYEDMSPRDRLPFCSYEQLERSYGPNSFDTVLLCTVLHHELDPDTALRRAFGLARSRVIVIENCITPDFPADYQQLVDIFFNHCLNTTHAPAPAQHLTVEQWSSRISRYGRVSSVQYSETVPGIPLGHHLIVIDKHAD